MAWPAHFVSFLSPAKMQNPLKMSSHLTRNSSEMKSSSPVFCTRTRETRYFEKNYPSFVHKHNWRTVARMKIESNTLCLKKLLLALNLILMTNLLVRPFSCDSLRKFLFNANGNGNGNSLFSNLNLYLWLKLKQSIVSTQKKNISQNRPCICVPVKPICYDWFSNI